VAGQSGNDNRKVWGKDAVVVNEKDIAEVLDGIAADKYCDNLRADRTPYMVDTICSANFLGVVQWARGVAISDHIDMRGRKNL
jgi:hypothetical protein